MACRGCAERRAAIGRAVKAATSGDITAIAREARAIGRSVADDAKALSSKAIASRLAQMRSTRR